MLAGLPKPAVTGCTALDWNVADADLACAATVAPTGGIRAFGATETKVCANGINKTGGALADHVGSCTRLDGGRKATGDMDRRGDVTRSDRVGACRPRSGATPLAQARASFEGLSQFWCTPNARR